MTRSEILSRAKPILFNTDMVRAILEGRKTVTRRVVKPQPLWFNGRHYCFADETCPKKWEDCDDIVATYQYQPSDILYVRETWNFGYIETSDAEYSHEAWFEEMDPQGRGSHLYLDAFSRFYYRADEDDAENMKQVGGPWRPSIHMPKEAARIFLRVTDVRVERLQKSFFCHGSTIRSLAAEGIDIGDQCRGCIETYGSPCCIDEESECGVLDDVRDDFARLWDSTINKSGLSFFGWAANPWVWVIEFERVKPPKEG